MRHLISPLAFACALLATAVAFTGCSSMSKSKSAGPATVTRVDLDRYMGRWYVISHVPYLLEKGKVASSDYYERRPDGKLINNFTFRKKTIDGPEKTWEGVAWVTDTESNATWKVRFIWPFSITYKIYLIDPDYRWAVVGSDDASLLWVLARERRLDSATYEGVVTAIRAKGIDPAGLVFVPQPEK